MPLSCNNKRKKSYKSWTKDGLHGNPSSMDILLSWLGDPSNFARWHKQSLQELQYKKKYLVQEIHTSLCRAGITYRSEKDIASKISTLQAGYRAAHTWRTNDGARLLRNGVPVAVVHGEVLKRFPFWTALHESFKILFEPSNQVGLSFFPMSSAHFVEGSSLLKRRRLDDRFIDAGILTAAPIATPSPATFCSSTTAVNSPSCSSSSTISSSPLSPLACPDTPTSLMPPLLHDGRSPSQRSLILPPIMHDRRSDDTQHTTRQPGLCRIPSSPSTTPSGEAEQAATAWQAPGVDALLAAAAINDATPRTSSKLALLLEKERVIRKQAEDELTRLLKVAGFNDTQIFEYL